MSFIMNNLNRVLALYSVRSRLAAAGQIVASGMKDAGYVYVNIDDIREGERDAGGVMHRMPNSLI